MTSSVSASSAFFRRGRIERLHALIETELFRPALQRPVARDLVVCSTACAAETNPASRAGAPLNSFMISAPSSRMHSIASRTTAKSIAYVSVKARNCHGHVR